MEERRKEERKESRKEGRINGGRKGNKTIIFFKEGKTGDLV